MARKKKVTTEENAVSSEKADVISTLEPSIEEDTIEAVLDSLDEVISPYEEKIHDYADAFVENVEEVKDNAAEAVGSVTEEIKDLMKETADIAEEASNKVEEIVGSISEDNSVNAGETTIDIAKDAIDKAEEAISDIKEEVTETAEVHDEIDDYFNSITHEYTYAAEKAAETVETVQEEVNEPASGDTIKIADADELKNVEEQKENKVKKTKEKKVKEKKVKEKKVKEKKTKKSSEEVKVEKLGFNWFFWINFIIIMVPCVYFVMLLLQASDKSDTPIIGDRIETDIQQQYTITEDNISQIKNSISSINGVEKCSVNLAVETLRITIDCTDNITVEEMKSVAEEAYSKVVAVLPAEQYFTVYQSYKQYDMEIDLYNNLESENFLNVALVKNSNMETYSITDLTTALNPEFYEELIAEMEAEKEAENNPQSDDEPEDGGNDISDNSDGDGVAEDERN